MTVTAGIDAGAENVKVVIVRDGGILSHAALPQGTGTVRAVAARVLQEAAAKAGVASSEIGYVVATGIGREDIPFAQETASEASCCARGASWFVPSADTVIDIGADKCLVVRCRDGVLLTTARNDRCASGTGRFLKIAAEPLGVDPQEMGNLSLTSQKTVEINNTCAVFAESEIISLIHLKHRPEDIAKAVFRGLARRISTLIMKVDFKPDLVMVGGVAKNAGMVKAMEEQAGCPVVVPEEPMIVGALGGALLAARRQTVH
jgi:(R)-2-hydroxyacyl-CoA dehydratese activating ATPase